MKCALIIPAWSPESIFSGKTAGSQINYWQPLGTLYVAASLKKAGHEVVFLNGAFMGEDAILNEVSKFRPGFAGIYSTTFGWKRAVRTAALLKRLDPGLFISVGGPYPIAVRGRCLEDSGDVDAVITGEGELTVPELVSRLCRGEGARGVAGVISREKDGIIINPDRPFIDDLDSIPFPARELLGEAGRYIPPPGTYKRKPVAVMMTSRGCNRRCIFCFQMDKSRASGIRYRSVENVMEEIELCLGQGYREIKFLDETLAADYGRAMRFAEEIKRRRLNFSWFASACVHQVDGRLLKAFKDAGCWAVLFGAESGLQKDLNTIRKGITLEQVRAAVKAAKKAGLRVLTPFIFGLPGQTFADGLKTIDFACELSPDVANFHSLVAFPGTELYDNLEKYGSVSPDTEDFTYQGASFVPYTMTRREIAELRQLAFKRFYSRPGFLLKRLLALRTASDFKAAGTGLKSLFWIWTRRGVFKRG